MPAELGINGIFVAVHYQTAASRSCNYFGYGSNFRINRKIRNFFPFD
jgi:hypothetical protein